ncbi:hypothetical protein ACP70R_029428 [Stipagrostis hirtigluma subsp. patula]
MSLITDDPDESPRDCSRKRHHHHHGGSGCGGSRRRRRALIAASSTVASLLSLSIILWLTLRPSSPRFSLLAATARAADNNASVILVDAAFAAHNPNARATALYDQLRATATYGGVPLSAGAPLPPLEQPEAGQGDALVSALLTSTAAAAPAGDVAVGARALLRVRLEGQLRWKVAAWVSGRHGLTVDCVAAVLLQPSPSSGLAPRVADAVGAVQGSQCATHVL